MAKAKFQVGDRVVVVALNGFMHTDVYDLGAGGVILIEDKSDNSFLVQFDTGNYKKEGCAWQGTKDAQWWVKKENMQVVTGKKPKKAKEKAAGLVIQAWALEVDGKIEPELVYNSRSMARRDRETYEDCGYKASVRRVEIKVLDHKV